ncbi:EAL domain-containing protein [Bordetella parapertussis]|uniref:cyclic-guanylate-specific phosphodiesterase n=1 Tax=Bordetella parapertussis (strain 12822 / ATCC BAA-587 / NCTC 13253) TaxID=257311 RepID=Q7W6U2_BORPA|nr:diguanylate phosphodiesterase [Bordetella parapertussis]AUL43853.1 cyclic diguanylate phosphodiesterase [Bordetella parapertussis]AWP62634.1 cyclic diguanylate phosphodiesterase [Bordetella parapertussis]AWP70132.1 cyclic diguanylate phosphodiesterase [Bordetella parapertussis]AWP89861.1 cyclic diguanylate phosphodiesterase [Bordetella parapertussis]
MGMTQGHVMSGREANNMTIRYLPVRHRLLFFVVPVLACGLVAAAIGYAWKGMHATSMVEHDNAHFLARSLDIAREQLDIVLEARVAPAACSEGDLAALRQRVFRSKYVADIARIDNGALRCSAVWGVWRHPHVLPRGGRTVRDGVFLWQNMENPIQPELSGDVLASERLAVFTIPGIFDDIVRRAGGQKTTLYSRKQGHVYKVFGASAAEDWQGWGAGFQLVRTAAACAPVGGPDICVETTARVDARGAVAVAGLGGMALGAGVGLIVFLWWRRSFGLRASLVDALRKGKIQVAYQPLRVLDSGRMAGVEALARWTYDEVGPISPVTFLGWVEAMGLRQPFTRYIVQAALDGMKTRMAGDAPFYLSINVFPEDLEDESFLDFLTQSVRERELSPGSVVLEVTESAVFSTASPSVLFRRFRAAGFRIFLDDFGVGYSNLGNIIRWEVDGIKLDRIFMQSLGDFDSAAPVLDQVIEMARQLDLHLVIEGIEVRSQADYIFKRAPHAVGQGWLFGRPGPACALPAA